MPFLSPHPGPFIPSKELETNCSTLCPPPLPLDLFEPPGDAGGRGRDDGAEPVAVLLMKKSPILQVQLLTQMTVNQKKSQKQMPQTPIYSDYEGGLVPGPTVQPFLC